MNEQHPNMEAKTTQSVLHNKNVVALGLVSLLNDFASEMAYPIIPIFLTVALGTPVAAVGLIEGVAEATASILKVFSGRLSDRLRNRKYFTASGYLLSSISKAVLSLAGSWMAVFGARFMDRFGKGIRTAARDALIADSTVEGMRGAAFGLHRAMDTAGAIIGPLTALALLSIFQNQFSLIFLLAAIPAFIGVCVLVIVVREPVHEVKAQLRPLTFSLSHFGPAFRRFLIVSVLFSLGNSSDAFLILRSQNLGYSTQSTVLLYVVFNCVYSLLSYPFGKMSDRFGARRVLVASLFVFAAVYLGFGLAADRLLLWMLFPAYGVFMAMNEGISKAYIADLVPSEERGTAIGLFYTATGVATFFSSLAAGLLWNYLGASSPFIVGGVLAALAGLLFARIKTSLAP
jgi:MFS family permease